MCNLIVQPFIFMFVISFIRVNTLTKRYYISIFSQLFEYFKCQKELLLYETLSVPLIKYDTCRDKISNTILSGKYFNVLVDFMIPKC